MGIPKDNLLGKGGNALIHALWLTLATTVIGATFTGIDWGLATRQYVKEQTAALEQQLEDAKNTSETNSAKIDTILELNLAREIDKILRWKCMNPGDDSRDESLRRYELEYRTLTGESYRRPSCEYLTGQ